MDRKRILIAFSMPAEAEALRKQLAAVGYDVKVVGDGAKALKIYPDYRPHVVLAELQLQKIDGHHLLRELRSQFSTDKTPFVLVAGHRSVAERVHSMNLGVDEYITSPFHPEEVQLRIEILLQEFELSVSTARRQGKGFSGRLDDMMLGDLLQALQIGRKSAFLKVHYGQSDGSIVMKEGELLTASLAELTPQEALLRMFTWPQGSFRVELRSVDQERDFAVSSIDLIALGSQYRADWDLLAAMLPPLQTEVVAAKSGDAGLSGPHHNMLQRINGQTTMLELIEESDVPDLEALKIAAELFKNGVLKEASQKEAGEQRPQKRTFQNRHQSYIHTIQSFLNTEVGTGKDRKLERRKKDRRSGSERRNKSRRLSDYVGRENQTRLNRTELLMIREKLANGKTAELNAFLKDIQTENANR